MDVSPPARAIPDNLADLVGNTPMARLTRVAPDCGAEIVGKLEAYNPAGSVKDRIGVAMIDAAEAEGRIEPGKTTIVEPTSGNTGIALAFVCAARGYELVLTMPQGMSRERESLLRLYGAEVSVVESMGGMDEAVDGRAADRRRARRLLHPGPVLESRQPGDPPAHHRGGDLARHGRQGRRLRGRAWAPAGPSPGWGSGSRSATPTCTWWRSSRSRPPCSPAARRARTRSRASAPASCPRCCNRDVIDEILPVDDEDALDTARLSARREGVLVGHLGRRGAVGRDPARGCADEFRGKRIVAVLPDSGERYISTPFFGP